MGDVSAALGAEATFAWRGKDWKLVPWDRFDLQKAFATWLKRRAWEELWAAKPHAAPPDYQEMTAALLRDLAAGAYGWGGDVWLKALEDAAAVEHLLRLTLLKANPGEDLTAHDVRALTREKGDDVMALMRGLVADPNSRAPALPGPG